MLNTSCWPTEFLRTVVICIRTQCKDQLGFRIKKESRRNCCNSPAARRVPRNADSICKQFNAKALGTQEKFHVRISQRRFRMPILGERFYQMSNAIFCYDLKPIPLAVYSYLVCCAGQKDLCWPSIKTIALHCNCSENAARDAVKQLTDRGFIRKVKTIRCARNGK